MTNLTDFRQAFLAASDADSAIKPPVRLAATVNITPIGIGQTIDGAVTAIGDRVLLTGQTDARQNGIRIVSDGIWPVASDFSNLVNGTLFTVTAGVSNAGQYTLTTANPIILGTSSLTFVTSAVGGLAAETAARIAADNTLQANINAEANTRATNDNAEAATRAAADATLQTNINSEAATRASSDTTLQTNITAEASTRATADTTITTNLAASSGSSLVGFTQSGTGAVTRTAQSKLSDSINVFDFMSSAQIVDIQGASVLDHTTPFQAATDAAKANGRRLNAPYGTYNVTAWNLNDITRGMEILGESDPYNAPVGGCTYIRYTGAGSGSPFTALSSFGLNFRNVRIGYNNPSFTGDLITTGWSSANLDVQDFCMEHVKLSGEGSGINANSLLKLDKTIIAELNKVLFELANNGLAGGNNYINVLRGVRLTFTLLNSKAILLGTATCQTVKFDTLTMEASASGKSCGFDMGAGLIEGLTFDDIWAGDVTVNGGGPWIHAITSGLRIMGGFMGTAGAGATDYPIQPDNCDGVWIGGGIRFDNRAINVPTTSRVIVISGAHVPLGESAIQNASNSTLMRIGNSGIADTFSGTIQIGGVTNPQLFFAPSSGATKQAQIQQSANVLNINDNGIANRMSLDLATGNTTISGTFVKADARLDQTTVAYTNNAAAQTATMTNGPTAGNPTKWIPINDNGTIRNIPAW